MENEAWPGILQRKRSREDEYADVAAGDSLGFTEHRSKRTQVLPLRTSPPSNRFLDNADPGPVYRSSFEPYPSEPTFPIATHTPGNSDSVEAAAAAAAAAASAGQQGWPCESTARPLVHAFDPGADQDTDMMDTEEPASSLAPVVAPDNLDQSSCGLTPISAPQGRMPTPVDCSFAAQVRGANWSGAIPSAVGAVTSPTECHDTQEDEDSEMGANDTAFQTNASRADAGCWAGASASRESIPRSLGGPGAAAQVMADWTMVQNRRLPSPINEGGGEHGGMDSPRTSLGSMVAAGCHPYHPNTLLGGHSSARAYSSAVELSRSATLSEEGGIEEGDGGAGARARQMVLAAGTEASPQSASSQDSISTTANDMGVEPALLPTAPSPVKRFGHTRSKHTLNSWTAAQPGMKRSFSIGYRPDCEKCRDKVPGHFNHIIIS